MNRNVQYRKMELPQSKVEHINALLVYQKITNFKTQILSVKTAGISVIVAIIQSTLELKRSCVNVSLHWEISASLQRIVCIDTPLVTPIEWQPTSAKFAKCLQVEYFVVFARSNVMSSMDIRSTLCKTHIAIVEAYLRFVSIMSSETIISKKFITNMTSLYFILFKSIRI